MKTATPSIFGTPQETVIYRGRFLQVRSYGCSTACRRVPTERQIGWHSMLFMRAGRFVRTHRGVPTLIDANHLAFYNRGEVYTVQHPDERGDKVTELEILPSVLAEIAETNDAAVADPMTQPFTSDTLLVGARAYQVQWEVWRAAMQSEQYDALEIEEAALNLAAYAIRTAAARRGHVRRRPGARGDTVRAHADLTHEVKLLLSRSYHRPLGLDAIARALHVSPYHLCRVFKQQTGLTIHRYLNALRLRASLDPLSAGRIDMPRLALALGFSSQSHFCRCFHREFGRTPSAARRGPGRMSKIVQDLRPG